MIRTFIAAAMLAATVTASPALAQPSSPNAAQAGKLGFTDAAAEALRKDIQGGLKTTIAQNLKLTAEEATRFWPVYDQYADELARVKEDEKTLFQEYSVKFGSYDDDAAVGFTSRLLAVDLKLAELRVRSLPKFQKALPGLKVATFFQVERSLTAVIDLQLTAQLPLLQSQADRPPV